jgi:serine/threonine protein kinase
LKEGRVLPEQPGDALVLSGSTCEGKQKTANAEEFAARYERINVPGKSTALLGKGSIGNVWLVRHKETQKLYALKTIKKSYLGTTSKAIQAALLLLEKEVAIHRRLIHDNIIRLHDSAVGDEEVYMLLDYATQGTLFSFLRARGKLSERQAFFFFVQVCSAVHFLHKQKLVHRDIKPENLLLGEGGSLKLCDFGFCAPCESGTEGR